MTARVGQLEKFTRVWASPRCRSVVVGGAAGVGKSRLAEEFAARAAIGGRTVLIGRATASSAAAAVPLGALAHLLPPGNDMSDPVNAFARVAAAIRSEGRGRAAAVLVDDLHLLDAVSAMLLRQLLDAGALRLIATLRTDLPRADAISALISGDSVHRIDLPAFTIDQSAAVVSAALGGAVARATVHELHTGSGGNALYLRELVLGGIKDGSLGWDGELWRRTADAPSAGTPRLAELIEARIAELGPAGLTVLELLAVAAPVSLAEAQAASGDPSVLTELELAGLIQVIEDRRRTLVLPAHPVYTETLRARMPVLRRRALLTAQADRIAATGARRREDALRIAVCRLAATGAADPALLAEAAVLARHAYDYPQARTMLEAMPSSAHTTATLVMLGEVFCELGDGDRAQSVFDQADARATGDREVTDVALARAFGLYWLAGRTDRAFEVVEGAQTRVRDESCLRMLRHSAGSMRIASGELSTGLALLEDLEPDVRSAPDATVWLMAAAMRATALGLTGKTELEVELAEQQYEAHRGNPDQTTTGFAHPATHLIQLSLAQCRRGDINQARETASRAHTELITTAATSHAMVWVTLALGDIESQAGHYAAARTWFAEAVALTRARRLVTPLNPALAGLAVSAAALGDLGAAEQAAAEAESYPPLGLCHASGYLLPARLAAARGDLERARALLIRGAELAEAEGTASSEAMLLTEVARFGDAARVAPRLAELAESCDGRFAPARARFAAALAADAPAELLDAAADLEAVGADLLAAEAATAAAAAYTRSADARRATAASHRARTLLDRCGPARTPLLAASQATATLTARERDIALAAARGASSQEIAARLNLSVRTVENHLYRAYAKLGVTSRRELVATLADDLGRTSNA
ncbi:MAG TPA: LuxR C-terminal-related transcriptional regulator [Actinospica sp.]|nr:LuxR C-terminal-related transcriptional regulator [Actinospica sp.]